MFAGTLPVEKGERKKKKRSACAAGPRPDKQHEGCAQQDHQLAMAYVRSLAGTPLRHPTGRPLTLLASTQAAAAEEKYLDNQPP